LIATFNPDPYYREVETMVDAIMARIPGFSTRLPPVYNWFGEPELKTQGLLNRAANPFTVKEIPNSVEAELLKLEKGFAPFPKKLANGLVDLTDEEKFGNGSGKSPYERMQELISGAGSEPSLRQQVEETAVGEKYQNRSAGSELFPGGSRWNLVAAIKARAEGRAWKQLLIEYPKLEEFYRVALRVRGASLKQGQEGIEEVEQMFGVELPKRR
jgi:hypothetical protein